MHLLLGNPDSYTWDFGVDILEIKMGQIDIRKYQEGKIEENKIKFSHNWNSKLNCKFFTTIRKPDVFSYYEQRIGEIFNVILNDEILCKALLRDATLTSLNKITPELLVLDAGTVDYKKMFERFHVVDQCVLLLFEKIEEGDKK